MVDFPITLPAECANAIWSQLPSSGLSAAMQVSSIWRQVLEPQLYERVHLRRAGALSNLLQTTNNRSDLARLVRHLSFSASVFDDDHTTTPAASAGPPDAAATQLLRRLPKLQSVHFHGWPPGPEILTSAMRDTSGEGDGSGAFPELRGVALGNASRPVAALRPVWNLPLLESLQTSIRNEPAANHDERWPPKASLARLSLVRTKLDERGVAMLLRAAPSLTSLGYDRWCNVGEHPMSLVHCGALAESLHHVQSTLQDLSLHISIYSDYAEEVEYISLYPVAGYLSLRGLTHLRSLEIPLVMALGWFPDKAPSLADVLPASLTYLHLTSDLSMQCTYEWNEDHVLEMLGQYFRSVGEAAPKLEVFEFEPDCCGDEWGEDLEERMSAMCAKAGVQCVFHY